MKQNTACTPACVSLVNYASCILPHFTEAAHTETKLLLRQLWRITIEGCSSFMNKALQLFIFIIIAKNHKIMKIKIAHTNFFVNVPPMQIIQAVVEVSMSECQQCN